jgi:hypothetical protein
MKIYYAHPISLYNTEQEQRDIATLDGLGFTIHNPNYTGNESKYQEKGMDIFKELIAGCDAIAIRAFPDGSISSGVANEIIMAQDLNMAVIELPTAILKRTLSVDETRQYLKEAGAR